MWTLIVYIIRVILETIMVNIKVIIIIVLKKTIRFRIESKDIVQLEIKENQLAAIIIVDSHLK